ncbi:MAG TPA: FHA domain-containing protein [Pyrinomonadaceae bacterium]|jgi:hypothetical protein
MPEAKVKFSGRECDLGDRLVTAGRSSDNDISFVDDSNVSRYHVEIEPRGNEYWVIDLKSSNGTAVNGEKLTGERLLNDGDKVVLGGSAEMEFTTGADAKAMAGEASTGTAAAPKPRKKADKKKTDEPAASGGIETEAAAASGGAKSMLIVAGILCCLALLCVVGSAGAYYFSRKSGCKATAEITKPENGDTISNPTQVEVDAKDTGCVAKAVFLLDGTEIAEADGEPYTATIDPNNFPDLSDGGNHSLQIVLVDQSGKEMPQAKPVLLAFETRAVGKPSPSVEIVAGNTNQQGQQQQSSQGAASVTLLETQQMTINIVKQFRGGFTYNVSNKQMLQEIQKMIPQYVQEGYFARATQYRDAINVAYVREQNLDATLGFMLAMSRSKFVPTKQGDNEGLWQMSNTFVTSNGYNGLCGTETLSDPSQNCAAKASALYMKAIVYSVFDGDEVYAAAAFGKSPADAVAWKATLPANRADVWNVIKTAPEREQLVRFFAAAIVTENPQKFGLKNDHPLSELYRVTQ